jgi:CubicO group peptidase (beta-lactamase class C family)
VDLVEIYAVTISADNHAAEASSQADGLLKGTTDDAFSTVADHIGQLLAQDPTYAGTLCVHHQGRRVVDLWWGETMQPDALLPVFSSSKGAVGLVVGCLVRDGALHLDQTVATYWPEFAARGKENVTVRQLLSHQAGLLGVDGRFTDQELYDHTPLAERLAAQRPLWAPGAAFAYHAVTIGVLADELVRRTTGATLGNYLRDVIAGPRGIEVYLGTPAELDDRVIPVQLPTAEELAQIPDAAPNPGRGSLAAMSLPTGGRAMWIECNEVAFRRAGTPAGGGLSNGRGLAGMYAAAQHEVGGMERLLDDETVAAMTQLQVWGRQLMNPSPLRSAFAIVFQKPTEHHPWGSYQAFGHDGAGGSLAFCDPFLDVAFGYTVQRIPLPGGADQRAIDCSRLVRRSLRAAR